MTDTMTDKHGRPLNAGLVAVPNRSAGGFNLFLTAGSFDPTQWVRGGFGFARGEPTYFPTTAELALEADRHGRALVRFADYFQLVAIEHPDMKKQVRSLTCCCCGERTRGRQFFNRDTGFGLCVECVPRCHKGETEKSFARCYGVRGVHYGV
jgi:hypothetical protein